MAELQR